MLADPDLAALAAPAELAVAALEELADAAVEVEVLDEDERELAEDLAVPVRVMRAALVLGLDAERALAEAHVSR